jgi:hypothetical protein
MFRPYGFITSKKLTYLTFESVDCERHLVFNPETSRAH